MTGNISLNEKGKMTGSDISFVFPMFNESLNIEETLQKTSELAREICDSYEIVVADDASTDASAEIVGRLASRDERIKLIRLEKNTKFGGALREGLKAASKDIVLYTDADFPAKVEDVKRALTLLDGADVVTAYSLVLKDESVKRIIMSKVYNFLVQFLFGLNIRDINSGLKIYKRKALEGLRLRSKSPFIDVEIFAELAKRDCRIRQYGLVFDLRTRGASNISKPSIVAQTFWDMLVYKFSG